MNLLANAFNSSIRNVNTYYYCGGNIPKVYRTKNNKLAVQLPFDMISAIGIKEGDDLDFLKYGFSTYIIARKNDIVKLLSKSGAEGPESVGKSYVPRTDNRNISVEPNELAVLKKLDTLKYNDRTEAKVSSFLTREEKMTLQVLIKKKYVNPFMKEGEKEMKYGISKNVYDVFLYGKRQASKQQTQAAAVEQPKARMAQGARPASDMRALEKKIARDGSEAYLEKLESQGFIVRGNEAEASMVSTALEESIRQGLVVGTRAFNKKFYISLRGFINKNAPKILKVIDQKSVNVSDISKDTGVDEDGVRTILYFLSESGDVAEVRRDIFRAT